jgi:hypothetical protein
MVMYRRFLLNNALFPTAPTRQPFAFIRVNVTALGNPW